MEFKVDYVDFTPVMAQDGIPSEAAPRALTRIGFAIEHPKGPIKFTMTGFISDLIEGGKVIFGETRDLETTAKKQVINPDKDGIDLWTPFIQATINKYWQMFKEDINDPKPGTWYRVNIKSEKRTRHKDRTGV